MYWKIIVSSKQTNKLGQSSSGTTEVFVGPFQSEREREAFRNFWEKEPILEEGEKIRFIPRKKLPKNRMPLAPGRFRGIERWKLL